MITLYTQDPIFVGIYTVTLEVILSDFAITPIYVDFTLTIVLLINNKPYFATKLPGMVTLVMPRESASWSFTLPKVIDADGEVVTVSILPGKAANFLYLDNGETLNIDDISEKNPNMKSGVYLLTVILDDGRDQVKLPFSLII